MPYETLLSGAEKLLQEVGRREEGKPDTDPYGTALPRRLSELNGKPERALSSIGKALATAEAIYEFRAPTLAWFHSRVRVVSPCKGKTTRPKQSTRNHYILDKDYRAMMALARLSFKSGRRCGALEWAEIGANLAPSQDNVIVLAEAHTLLGRKTERTPRRNAMDAQSSLHVHGRALALFYADMTCLLTKL